ncbi:MAG: glycosyltransferase, partial [Nitrososphaerales archaeon]
MSNGSGSTQKTQNAGAACPRARVLLLIKGLGAGGAERLLVDVVRNGNSDLFEYEVAYVLTDQDALARELETTGVPIHDLGATASWDLRWLVTLRKLLLRRRFDVLHSHLPYTASFGRIVALTLAGGSRPALVYTEHSLWKRAAVLTKALNRATIHMDRALFVVSPAARGALPPSLRHHARVVVHGVDRTRCERLLDRRDEARREVRAEIGVRDPELVVLTVANLRGEKGYDILLEAASQLEAEDLPLRFVSVGSGPDEDKIHAARDAVQLQGCFEFLGLRTDTLRLMVGSDIFVRPSHQEGMPVALMEAMSVGLPVVATAVGGVPDI